MTWAIVLTVGLLLLGLYYPLRRLWKLSVIVGNAVPSPIQPFFDKVTQQVTMEDSFFTTGSGDPLPLRTYHPHSTGKCPAVILYPGASPAGEKHEALNQLARSLAKAGFRVFLPRIPELKEVLVREASVEHMIEAFIEVRRKKDVDASRVVVVGVSFGGSLLIKACTDRRMRGKPMVVLSYGSHFDLEKTLQFALTGDFSDGSREYHLKPQPWGRVTFFHNFLEYVEGDFNIENVRSFFLKRVQDDEEAANKAYGTFPRKDRLFIDMIMDRESQEAWQLVRKIMQKVRPVLEPISPRHFVDDIDFPVFLMHGANDTMIPFTETVMFDRVLRERGREVTTLISYLYAHSDVEGYGRGIMRFMGELWKMGRFLNKALGKAFSSQ